MRRRHPRSPRLSPPFRALLAATTLALAPSLAAADDPAAGCPQGAALVLGPPAAELFDPHMPQAGEAVWCEVYDERGHAIRSGAYRDHYPSGAARSRARFEHDRLEGEVVILHENGRVWLHTFYSAGLIHGAYTLFSPSGAPWLTAHYEDGQAEGRHTTWFEGGGKASETWYRAGVEHGLSRAWYPGGRLRQAIEVRDGRFVGEHATWHENGEPARVGRYAPCPPDAASAACRHLGSARHGEWRGFHPNGALAAREHWHYGVRTGTWVEWDADGNLAALRLMVEPPPEHSAADRMASRGAPTDATPN